MIQLLVNGRKWSSLLARTRALITLRFEYFSSGSKLTGLLRNGPQDLKISRSLLTGGKIDIFGGRRMCFSIMILKQELSITLRLDLKRGESD